MTLDEFITGLASIENGEALTDFCRKYVLHGTPHIFYDKEDAFYDFRKRIAQKFDISFHEVYITGSAKLGFSPFKRTSFDYDSDIDVAIVSEHLFDEIMERVRQYQMSLRSSRRSVSSRELEMYHAFLEYAAIGWIRPDKLPISFQVAELKTDWFDFFSSLSYGKSEVGNYKVSAGVFCSYRHLEIYSLSSIQQAKSATDVEKKK
jgi:vacuolar-type H+-ATPase subunit F/Vma7